jgi:hypothetical protein
MQNPAIIANRGKAHAMPEAFEILLSALAGVGIVLMLAFFLSLEAWVVSAAS